MNRRWFRALFRRRVLIILMLLIQAVFLVYLITSTSRVSQVFSNVLTLVSLLAVLYIVSKKDKGAYKTTWVFLILSFPLFSPGEDDRTATVGTTNLDFRSLYLHFECGALIFDSTAVREVKEDFLNTLKVCQPITEKDCHPGVVMKLFQDVLRLFAPLM